jgi:hypothetical protein
MGSGWKLALQRGLLALGCGSLLATAVSCSRGVGGGPAPQEASPQEVFERRILPIFKSPNPSSCTQCHLAGVDLKNYILPSSEKTFLSLRDQGLIDLDQPEQSKILHLIQMGEKDSPGAALIHEKTRRLEYEAFSEWIKASCRDPKLRAAPPLAPGERAGPPRPAEVIRHDRKDHLLASFERTVWAMRFRCMSCHIEGTPENDKLRREHGDRVAWIKAAGPEATMSYLLASRLIDRGEPEKSLLLQKPLGAVKHGGGRKLLPGDQGYQAFRAWLEDCANTVGDKYATAADLPPEQGGPDRFGTDVWLKLANTPPQWGDRLLQVNLYAWDAARNAWEGEPIASSDRGVWGQGKLWQHNLTLLAAPGSERARKWRQGRAALPPGRYLVRVYVDVDGRLAKDWQATLGETDYAGQAEVTSRWPAGYGSMTAVDARQVRR